MNDLLGDTLINKNGDSLATADVLAGKTVGIYFSAHWCPPCRGYTPKLVEIYNKTKDDSGKPFEIVFVSSDSDEDSFKEYLAEMPWLALPFADRDRKNELSKKYGVKGIPTLVIVDSDGNTITTEGRAVVTRDPDGFPWKPRSVSTVLGTVLRKPDGATVDVSTIEGKVLGLYFSAHWCPPCRRFTPEFGKIYEEVKKRGKEFEVVFVSSDKTEEEFNEYHSSHPWLALPYSERSSKSELSTLFNVKGIPALVILDEKREVINLNARGAISDVSEFPWRAKEGKGNCSIQ